MKFRMLVAAIIGALVTAVVLGAALVRNGASAQAGLTQTEERIMYELRRAAVAADARDHVNPYDNVPDAWREAAAHFKEECAVCHGPAGQGDGELGEKLFPAASDLTHPRVQQLSDAELHHIITEGIRLTGMPAMGAHDSPEEIWKLVALIRKLPELSEDDVAKAAGSHQESDAAHVHDEPDSDHPHP